MKKKGTLKRVNIIKEKKEKPKKLINIKKFDQVNKYPQILF